MEGNTATSYLVTFLPLILIFVAFWFFLIRPQKKKDQKVAEMRRNVSVGDEIVTIGGVVGKVLSVKDDAIVIYCGSDKTKMEFKKWAVSEVTKKNEKPVKEIKDAGEEAEIEAPQKKKIKKLVKKTDEESVGEEASGVRYFPVRRISGCLVLSCRFASKVCGSGNQIARELSGSALRPAETAFYFCPASPLLLF